MIHILHIIKHECKIHWYKLRTNNETQSKKKKKTFYAHWNGFVFKVFFYKDQTFKSFIFFQTFEHRIKLNQIQHNSLAYLMGNG